ncbi:MAG: DsbE family thiol:disulfide interchange protein [Rickettsiales bacterium]|nr:DsbE family thiol:disulfide interchange protein [Rickettsiales bacterium]OUV54908.1 MAG: hypothetical protein CBC87_00125 [Rickettsiales bacterium TMED127]
MVQSIRNLDLDRRFLDSFRRFNIISKNFDKRMKYLILFSIVGFFLYIFINGLSKDPKLIPSNLINKDVPNFVLKKVLNKNNFNIFDFQKTKEIKIVNFFASWCPPCRIEHPQLMQLSEISDVSLYGINKKDNIEDLKKFLDELGNPFLKIGSDPDGRASFEWGVYGLPETFIVDKNGKVRLRHVGPILERDITEIKKLINFLKNE